MPKQAGDFNEGLMEIGERICLPNGKPNCEECPLQEFCLAKKENLTDSIPVRKIKTKRRKEQKTVFLLEYKGKIAIRKRESKGLLANLYEFPNVDEKLTKKAVVDVLKKWNLEASNIEEIGMHHHIFSHVEWEMIGYRIAVETMNEEFIWVKKEELLEEYAIPGAFGKFREKILGK